MGRVEVLHILCVIDRYVLLTQRIRDVFQCVGLLSVIWSDCCVVLSNLKSTRRDQRRCVRASGCCCHGCIVSIGCLVYSIRARDALIFLRVVEFVTRSVGGVLPAVARGIGYASCAGCGV